MDNAVTKVRAELVRRLRVATGLPWMKCKKFLAGLTPVEQIKYIESIEAQPSGIFHDPIEDDPAIRPLYLAICKEVSAEVAEWHRQRIAEMEQRSPAAAELFRNGLGLCHLHWKRIKELMKERHGIDWQSPSEMNPGTIFD